jgi:hypothetical protein
MPPVPDFVRRALKLASIDDELLGVLTPDRDERFAHFYFHPELRALITELEADLPRYQQWVDTAKRVISMEPPSMEQWAAVYPSAYHRLSALSLEERVAFFIGVGQAVEIPPEEVVKAIMARLEGMIGDQDNPRVDRTIDDFQRSGRDQLKRFYVDIQKALLQLKIGKTWVSPEELRQLSDWFEEMEASEINCICISLQVTYFVQVHVARGTLTNLRFLVNSWLQKKSDPSSKGTGAEERLGYGNDSTDLSHFCMYLYPLVLCT